jgi:hypothetical protein
MMEAPGTRTDGRIRGIGIHISASFYSLFSVGRFYSGHDWCRQQFSGVKFSY